MTAMRVLGRLAGTARDTLPRPAGFLERLERHGSVLLEHLEVLYGDRPGFDEALDGILTEALLAVADRPSALVARDRDRLADPRWYQRADMVGAWAYVDRFCGTVADLPDHVSYLEELGVTYLHLMPLFARPPGPNDGGYAVSSYRELHPPLGIIEDLRSLTKDLHDRGISLALDLVFNHTSSDHAWARAAKLGSPADRACYLTFAAEADTFEWQQHLRVIFPEEKPGSFVYVPEMERWVWSTFHAYQWDLDYANPEVFRRMLREMLFLANVGVDVLRLDAVPFIWKELGTPCENLPQTHTIIRAFNALVRIAAPATLFKSEAIVHPDHVRSYLGTGTGSGVECELSYHPLLMVELWEALATGRTHLLRRSMEERFPIPRTAAWVNYVRSHDDIGWGFADEDAASLGIDPYWHRRFLNRFYMGDEPGSFARGVAFQENEATGDARVSGTTASLAGLEHAMLRADERQIEHAIRRVLLLYGIVAATPGFPLLDLGDELGTLNELSYLYQPELAGDSRWIHRPHFDWERAQRRHHPGTIEGRIFGPLTHMLRIRKATPAFAAGVPYRTLDLTDDRVFAAEVGGTVVVVASFVPEPVTITLDGAWEDLLAEHRMRDTVTLDAYGLRWLVRR